MGQDLANLVTMGQAKKATQQQAAAVRENQLNQQRIDTNNVNRQNAQSDTDRALQASYHDQAERRQVAMDKIFNEGYTDPTTGVTSKYVPGQGWVTSYSPEQGAIIKANQREELARSTTDQAAGRRGRQNNETRRNNEGAYANTLLEQLKQPDPYSTDRIVGDLANARRVGVNEGYDKTLAGILTSNQRTGTSSDNILLKSAKERGQALNDASAGAYTQGASLAEDLRGARNSRLSNSYNQMAERAGNVDNVAFQPTSVNTGGKGAIGGVTPGSTGNQYGVDNSAVAGYNPDRSQANLEHAQRTGANIMEEQTGINSVYNIYNPQQAMALRLAQARGKNNNNMNSSGGNASNYQF